MRQELKPRKLHRILGFNQSQYLKPYIEFNTQKRIEAENIKTKMVKCSTNQWITLYAVKTMENLRNGINVRLETTKKTISNGHQNQAICRKKILIII